VGDKSPLRAELAYWVVVSAGMRHLKRLGGGLVGLLAALAAAGGLASSANAREYHASRPGVVVNAVTEGHRITVGFEVKTHCDDGSSGLLVTGLGRLQINRHTGRFRGASESNFSDAYVQVRVHGTAHPRVVTGEIFARIHSRHDCRTGSADDRWVAFVARPTTTYTARRSGFSIELKTQRRKVVEIAGRYTLHCSDGRVAYPDFAFGPRFIRNGPGGTFKARFEAQIERKIRGTVRNGAITGHLFHRLSPPFDRRPDCWSGRSLNDPWVRFVARRQ
jgi:hypothetical protein